MSALRISKFLSILRMSSINPLITCDHRTPYLVLHDNCHLREITILWINKRKRTNLDRDLESERRPREWLLSRRPPPLSRERLRCLSLQNTREMPINFRLFPYMSSSRQHAHFQVCGGVKWTLLRFILFFSILIIIQKQMIQEKKSELNESVLLFSVFYFFAKKKIRRHVNHKLFSAHANTLTRSQFKTT